MKLYQIDSNRYYTGEQVEVPDTDPIPSNYAIGVDPPQVNNDEYLRWNVSYWEVTNVSPESFNATLLQRKEEERLAIIELKKQKDPTYWKLIRDKRDQLLSESDWTQLADVSLPNLDAWKTYRQELRDVPSKFELPEDVVWPALPSNEQPTANTP